MRRTNLTTEDLYEWAEELMEIQFLMQESKRPQDADLLFDIEIPGETTSLSETDLKLAALENEVLNAIDDYVEILTRILISFRRRPPPSRRRICFYPGFGDVLMDSSVPMYRTVDGEWCDVALPDSVDAQNMALCRSRLRRVLRSLSVFRSVCEHRQNPCLYHVGDVLDEHLESISQQCQEFEEE